MARCGRLGDRLRFFQLGAISMVLTPDFGEERELFDGRREGFGGSDPRGCVRRKLSNRKAVARRLPLGGSMRVVLKSSNITIPADGYLGSRNDEGRSEM